MREQKLPSIIKDAGQGARSIQKWIWSDFLSQGMSTASVTANPSYDLLIHSVEGLEEMPRQGQLILVNDVGDDFTEVTNELSL